MSKIPQERVKAIGLDPLEDMRKRVLARLLDPEHGVPMQQLEGEVKFYAGPKDKGKFKGIVRSSLNTIYEKDGELILSLLRTAEASHEALGRGPRDIRTGDARARARC